jgi:hypothetical protein
MAWYKAQGGQAIMMWRQSTIPVPGPGSGDKRRGSEEVDHFLWLPLAVRAAWRQNQLNAVAVNLQREMLGSRENMTLVAAEREGLAKLA